jgi:hypothetical protein
MPPQNLNFFTASETGGGGVLCKGDDVVPAGRPSVDEPISAPVLAQTEYLLVEPQRACEVPDGEIDVRKAVGLNHCCLETLSRLNTRPEWGGTQRVKMLAGAAIPRPLQAARYA